jgi:TonB family protein
MRIVDLAFLCTSLLAGCAGSAVEYEVEGQRVHGVNSAAKMLEEKANAAVRLQEAQVAQTPRVIRAIAPVVPEQAIAMGIEGDVTVLAKVESDGIVSEVKIVSSTHDLLAEAVTSAMKQWTFSSVPPGMFRDTFWFQQTYKFRLSP